MVGVPGKSNACFTCKQRKIKCSAERPRCSQCQRSKRVCGGYRTGRIFVDPKGRRSTAADAPRQTSNEQYVELYRRFQADRLGYAPSPAPLNLFQLFSSGVNGFLPNHDSIAAMDWLIELPSIHISGNALEKSATAWNLLCLGRLHNDLRVRDESFTYYTQALAATQSALHNPLVAFNDETLAACLLIFLYESFEGTHSDSVSLPPDIGLCAGLVYHRGPGSHTEGFAHSMFQFISYGESLRTNRLHCPTYLSMPVWNERPWNKLAKTPLDVIHALYRNDTAIQHRVSRLPKLPLDDAWLMEVRDLIYLLWEADACLEGTLQTMSSKVRFFQPGCGDDQLNNNNNNNNNFGVEATSTPTISFTDLQSAMIFVNAWAFQAILWPRMVFLYGALEDKYHLLEPTTRMTIPLDVPPLAHRTNWIDRVHKVLVAATFFLQPQYYMVGPWIVTSPLLTASSPVFEANGYEAEKQAIGKLIAYLGNERLATLKFLDM